MTTERPFFSAGLLVTAPDGTYGGIRRSQQVAAYDDRIEIGTTKIYYQYLTDLRVYGNVLHVTYAAADGKQVEQFFKYNTFLAKNGAKALAEMTARAASARTAIVKPSIWKPDAAPVQKPLKVEMLDTTETGWQRIVVYSALVAFPASCPVCIRPADTVVPFQMAAGLGEKGSWLVPVCREHEAEFTKYLAVDKWRANKSRLEFHAWNRDYAKLFLLLNTGENPEQVRRQAEASPLLVAIKNGLRLVQFQYTVSAVYLSMMMPSKIYFLQPGQKPFLAGLKYSLLSALAGWWSIAGLIWTPAVIIRNSRVGIDLTKTVVLVLSGAALSAGGYR
jgi:hypothetical protein